MTVAATKLLAGRPDYFGEVWVDAFGRPVEGRQPDERDFIAFQPPAINFRGTVPEFTYDKNRSGEDNQRGYVRRLLEENANRSMLEEALFLVAQSDDGRRLLAMANDLKFSIAFDQRATEARGALGLMDYQNKLIPLHPETTPERLARTLRHELQHMDDIHEGVDYNSTMSLKSILMAGRALEGAARSGEAQLGVQLAESMPGDHPRQFKTTAVIASFCQTYSAMGKALLQSVQAAKEGRWQEFGANLMKSYYAEAGTLANYDQDYVRFLSKDLDKIFPHNFMAHDVWTHEALAARLKIRGKPFLPSASPAFDLGQPPFSSFVRDQNSLPLQSKLIKKLHRKYDASQDHTRIDAVLEAMEAKTDLGLWRNVAVGAGKWVKSVKEQMTTKQAVPAWVRKAEVLAVYQLPLVERLEGYGQSDTFGRAAFSAPLFAEQLMALHVYDDLGIRFQFALEASQSRSSDPVNSLVRAGLRGPVRAFPEEYLNRMLIKLDGVQRLRPGHSQESFPHFTHEEALLFRHWMLLAKNGVDPVTGLQAGEVQTFDYDNFRAKVIGKILAPSAKVAGVSIPMTIPASEITEWSKTVQAGYGEYLKERMTPRGVVFQSRRNDRA